jgi:hypothetical protein
LPLEDRSDRVGHDPGNERVEPGAPGIEPGKAAQEIEVEFLLEVLPIIVGEPVATDQLASPEPDLPFSIWAQGGVESMKAPLVVWRCARWGGRPGLVHTLLWRNVAGGEENERGTFGCLGRGRSYLFVGAQETESKKER